MPEPEKTPVIDPAAAAAQDAATLPKELEGKTAADIWKMVEAERAKVVEITKSKERSDALAQDIAMAALDQRRAGNAPAGATPVVDAEPDREEDMAGWIQFQIKKGVAEGVRPLVESYTRDRGIVMASSAETAITKAASKFHDWDEHQAAVNAFLQNYPAEVRAQAAAVEEAYYRVKGHATTEKEREARVREQNSVGAGGRVGGLDTRVAEPKLSDEQTRVTQNLLGGVPAEMLTFDGAGAVSIDDFLAAKSRAAEKAKGGNNAARQ